MSELTDLQQQVKQRIASLKDLAPDTIGDMMEFQFVDCQPQQGEYTLRCKTFPWMRNVAGTLHGGMCATIVDQAMGFIAFCAKPGEGTAPTIQLQLSYHRPLIPGEDVLIRVRVVSVTRSLMHLTAEASLASAPDRICLTSTGTYFFKPAAKSE